jgi:hypothetical protein
MNLAFLHVWVANKDTDDLAAKMVHSARKFGYHVIQMTDETTPQVSGVDEVRRLPWNGKRLMTYRMKHLARLGVAALIVDTDILITQDVSDIREYGDIVLTKRTKPILDKGVNITPYMPYNTGVMWCSAPIFWECAYKHCLGLSDSLQDWYGDQVSVKLAADTYKVTEVPVEEWNYTPTNPQDCPATARILHYKGMDRKAWMRA